ncbi:hypothetical protein BEWA_004670 [Theileria equi strain WA]|uniref:RNA-editing substrate-binding complex 6 protein domain-containing protein n=1 Tax=Theileria equi strain WA TaxID=1537102 RepID=L0B1Q3_THEEQ|nr:hypothetical protein BEWA_004670 [Theileria equi strain WA]AFZ81059.1 hypothetical protein BEWA_004670 [Theileria equi strain WA]|eukprot:XP_004830725.1 hypothetical protein BEWA_004670 [Theileria equi strain WA]
MCNRIHEFSFFEIRIIARNLSIIFETEDAQRWSEPIANFALKRSQLMPMNILCPLVNSIAKIGHRDEGFYEKIFEIGVERIKEAQSIDLVTLSQTIVLLKMSRILTNWETIRKTMSKICTEVSTPRILSSISATDAVLFIYSLAKTNHLNKAAFRSVVDVILDMDPKEFEPCHMPLVLYSFAAFKFKKARPLSIIMGHISAIVEQMTPAHISNCLCSLTRLEIRNIDLVNALVDKTKTMLDTIQARELGNIVYGLSNLEYDNLDFINELIEKFLTLDRVDEFSCVHILYAMGRYKINNEETIHEIIKKIEGSLERIPSLSLIHIVWSCSRLGCNRFDMIERSVDELRTRSLNKHEQEYFDKVVAKI